MNGIRLRSAAVACAAGMLILFAAACGSSEEAAPGAAKLTFELTDDGCQPLAAKAPAGPIEVEAENTGTSKVTEIEVMEGDSILGEKEDLAAGLSGSFSLNLDPGTYTVYCPGGDREKGTLTVTGGEAAGAASPAARKAVARYRGYLEENAAQLVDRTGEFVAAVEANEDARAERLYPVARAPYERIEPVAESFGDLDPRIDGRANEVPAKEFEGFHWLERMLWVQEDRQLMEVAPLGVPKRLLANVESLRKKVGTVELTAVQIANGANELLGEVSASKITGEEERYSHTDLYDFEANVEGAEAAFEAVKPLLDESDPELSGELEADFKAVFAELEPYRRGNGFVSYAELTEADTRKLAQPIDRLAEKLSEVPAAIASAE